MPLSPIRDENRPIVSNSPDAPPHQRVQPTIRPVDSFTSHVSPLDLSPAVRALPASNLDRLPASPPFPSAWSPVHDRAICVLDARDYTLTATVTKLRRAFPELHGVTLTPVMVEKRLRILDQIVEIDYWRMGLRGHTSADRAGEAQEDAGRNSIDSMIKSMRGGGGSGSLSTKKSSDMGRISVHRPPPGYRYFANEQCH
ncbi:hypothetical protein LTR50_002293 [Elasticomyces elasticus]|nr:hypothetical protein LTR50_002293 [Elasticomyces elasticus]